MATTIPSEALDDRLAFVGNTGSGKSNAACTGVERLLAAGARVGIVDPTSVWWGLRLNQDGKTPSKFKAVIFGGEHADIEIGERAGALVGDTAATMDESFILDLGTLGTKASERRFMLGFLTALYSKATRDPLTLVIDEADMFAPQHVTEKDGEAHKLLGQMETVCRRGRVRGFHPWLITQRPAVLNKNVLSQVDGLVAMKLTSSQDRAAVRAWIEDHADRDRGRNLVDAMPAYQRGQALVWIPGRGLLEEVQFPLRSTFDSGRTPARGEARQARTLKPLDVEGLKKRLSAVDAEQKANDPSALRGRVHDLEAKLKAAEASLARSSAAASRAAAAPTPLHDAAARKAENARAFEAGFGAAREQVAQYVSWIQPGTPAPRRRKAGTVALGTGQALVQKKDGVFTAVGSRPTPEPAPTTARSAKIVRQFDAEFTNPQRKVIEALWFWCSLGFVAPSREQVAAAAGYSHGSGGFKNLVGALHSAGAIEISVPGHLELAPSMLNGNVPEIEGGSVRERLGRILTVPQAKVLDVIPAGGSFSRESIAISAGYSSESGGFKNILGALRTLGLIQYPMPNFVAVEAWVHKQPS